MTSAPVDNKVAVQTAGTLVSAIITYVTSRYAIHIDADTTNQITIVISTLVGGVLGWFTKHSPRTEEVVIKALEILKEYQGEIGTMGSSGAGTTPLPVDTGTVTDDTIPAPSPTFPTA